MQVYAQKLEYPATNLLNMVAFEIFMVNVGGGKMLQWQWWELALG